MLNQIQKDTETRMKKSVEGFHNEMNKLRTGRAHPSLLDAVMVPYYGNDTPLSQVASITVEDARTLLISPWEKTLIPAIEKAIRSADLGLNPATSGQVVRVPLPPLTEERRKEMVKQVRGMAEDARVAVRNIRRDANTHTKDLHKAKKITEDEEHQQEEAIQKFTDKYVAEIEKLLTAKEAELMKV